MPNPVAAIAGVSVVSGVMGSRAADRSSRRAAASDAASLAFEQQKYDDWKETYGGIEDNLSEYYNSLTPEYYAARGLEAFQKEQQRAFTTIKTSLAQRGIEDSGIALAAERAFAQDAAVQRATIRANASSAVAEEQRGFLQVGLGQQPGASYSAALANKANSDNARALQDEAAAGRAASTAISTAGTALADYLNKPEELPQTTMV